jgi:hypothetical protein
MNPFNVVAVFCDDIREEVRNRHTLVGVYPDNVTVPKIPGRFSRLALYARVHFDVNSEFDNCSLHVRLPDGEEKSLGNFSETSVKEGVAAAKEKGLPTVGLIMQAVFQNVPIKAAGRIDAIASVNGEQFIAGVLNVILKEEAVPTTSTASPQPSAQSQPVVSKS